MSFSLSLHFLPVLFDQCLLNSKVLSCFSGVIMSIRSFFLVIKKLGLDNCSTPTRNSTYTSCQMSFEDIVNTHDTFMKSLGIELSDDDKKLPYLYWTPKLHKSPVKHRFIAGFSKCTTKELSSLLTKIQS